MAAHMLMPELPKPARNKQQHKQSISTSGSFFGSLPTLCCATEAGECLHSHSSWKTQTLNEEKLIFTKELSGEKEKFSPRCIVTVQCLTGTWAAFLSQGEIGMGEA